MPDDPVAILKVRDVTTSLEWYRRAGFTVRGYQPEDAPTWAEVGRDGLVLQLLGGDATPWDGEPRFTGCFYVRPASVRAVHAELDGVVELPWGVEEREWGAVEVVIHDPDGYVITFTGDA
jgi:hypothetical protein